MAAGSELNGKVAVVTGASRGIGRAVAERLARNGASVIVNYVASAEKAAQAVATIEQNGGTAKAIQANISELSDIRRLFEETMQCFGRIDILVNNAGVSIAKPIEEITEEDFDRLVAVNFKGLFFCCQQASRYISNGGRIINISTTAHLLKAPKFSIYAGSKGAVEHMTPILSKELGARGITVNTVSPGPVNTELFSKGKTKEQINRFAQMSDLGRIGEADDIADVIAFLAGEHARWITGQNIRVNGGIA